MPTHKIAGVHPTLVEKILRTLAQMQTLGFEMLITDGVRTLEKQQSLYAQGRTTPGAIVTDCDGIKKRSNHQPKDDGFGHAVDCCFIVNGQASWVESLPWGVYGALAQYNGLKWGIKLSNGAIDKPHVELLDAVH